jgi:hypothetical protein
MLFVSSSLDGVLRGTMAWDAGRDCGAARSVDYFFMTIPRNAPGGAPSRPR